MRSLSVAALILVLAACDRDGRGEELAGGTGNELSSAEIDAALGPADQSGSDDAFPAQADPEERPPNGATAQGDPVTNGVGNEEEAQ